MNAEEIYKHIDKFTDIETQEPPKNELVTVFCDDGDWESGFVEDTLFSEIGINMFIAKKWILQTELKNLL